MTFEEREDGISQDEPKDAEAKGLKEGDPVIAVNHWVKFLYPPCNR